MSRGEPGSLGIRSLEEARSPRRSHGWEQDKPSQFRCRIWDAQHNLDLVHISASATKTMMSKDVIALERDENKHCPGDKVQRTETSATDAIGALNTAVRPKKLFIY